MAYPIATRGHPWGNSVNNRSRMTIPLNRYQRDLLGYLLRSEKRPKTIDQFRWHILAMGSASELSQTEANTLSERLGAPVQRLLRLAE